MWCPCGGKHFMSLWKVVDTIFWPLVHLFATINPITSILKLFSSEHFFAGSPFIWDVGDQRGVVVEKLLDWLGPMSVRRSWRLVWKLPQPTYIKPQIVTTSLKNSGDRLTVCQDSPSQTFSKLAKPSWIYIFPERVQTLIFNDKFSSVQEEVKWEILRKTK